MCLIRSIDGDGNNDDDVDDSPRFGYLIWELVGVVWAAKYESLCVYELWSGIHTFECTLMNWDCNMPTAGQMGWWTWNWFGGFYACWLTQIKSSSWTMKANIIDSGCDLFQITIINDHPPQFGPTWLWWVGITNYLSVHGRVLYLITISGNIVRMQII